MSEYEYSFEKYAPWVLSIPNLPSFFHKHLITAYQKKLLEIIGYQSFIHKLNKKEAQKSLNSFAKVKSVTEKLANNISSNRNKNLHILLAIINEINSKINENNFLLTLIIEDEFDKSMSIEETLEDYYDSLDAKNREFEEKIPFETFLKIA
jgi:recombinational DNA repair ATPase RecF